LQEAIPFFKGITKKMYKKQGRIFSLQHSERKQNETRPIKFRVTDEQKLYSKHKDDKMQIFHEIE
jgi:hypothetical protein